MDVEARGVLQFKTRAALAKAIVAFDDSAYTGFFDSAMWSLAGPFAACDAKFEIEVDCDYERAFRAVAKTAADGIIELRDRREKSIVRYAKRGTKWERTPSKTFGADTAKLVATWAKQVAAAKAADDQVEAKAAKRSKATSIVVDAKFNLTAGAMCTDGTIAIATPKRVMFYSIEGKPLGEQMLEESARWISDLLAMPDGSVAAYNREGCDAIAFVRPGGVEHASCKGEFGYITAGIAHANGVSSVWGGLKTYVLENKRLRELCARKDSDFVHGALPWRDGVLSWKHGEVAFHTMAGKQQWKAVSYAVVTTGDLAITAGFDNITVRTQNGKAKRVLKAKPPGHAPSFQRDKAAWVLEGDRLFVANQAVEEWDIATGKLIASVETHNRFAHLCGCLRVGDLTAAWADKPVLDAKDRDSRVVFVRGTEVVDQFDAKSDVLEGINLGSDAIAVRTKTKMFVWRAGTVQTLGGHKAIAGFMATPEGRLVSWGTDKTFRIWSL